MGSAARYRLNQKGICRDCQTNSLISSSSLLMSPMEKPPRRSPKRLKPPLLPNKPHQIQFGKRCRQLLPLIQKIKLDVAGARLHVERSKIVEGPSQPRRSDKVSDSNHDVIVEGMK